MKNGRLRNDETRRVIAKMLVPTRWWERAIGLLGRSTLDSKWGMWLEPCSGVHTIGMRFAIDIVILDKSGTVIRIEPQASAGRIVGPVKRARAVIELPAGTIERLGISLDQRYSLVAEPNEHEPGRAPGK